MTTLTTIQFQDTKLHTLFDSIKHGHAWLWRSVKVMLLGAALMFALQLVDARLIAGVSVWDKPAKFFLALAVQYGTISWALSLLHEADRTSKAVNRAVALMLCSGWAEMAYMIFRASRAEASHFNFSTPVAAIAYGAMGVGSLLLTGTAAYVGAKIWTKREGNLWREAAALGLIVSAVLGTLAGAYMSAQTGHWVGGPHTDAGGLTFFNWSTRAGDLRPAHFMGLHAAQFIPLAALSGERRFVWAVAALLIGITAVIFALGVAGIPLLRG